MLDYKSSRMQQSRVIGIAFLASVLLCLLKSGGGRTDAETFEPMRVADKMVGTLQSVLTFEPASVLDVSMKDVNIGPIEKSVSIMDVIYGRVSYKARVSVVPNLEAEKNIVKASTFTFDVESSSPEGVKEEVIKHVTSLRNAIKDHLKLKGLMPSASN